MPKRPKSPVKQPSITAFITAKLSAEERMVDARSDWNDAAWADAAADLRRIEGELIKAKLHQQRQPPRSVRTVSGGRVSPR
jgi:hypothetical protein